MDSYTMRWYRACCFEVKVCKILTIDYWNQLQAEMVLLPSLVQFSVAVWSHDHQILQHNKNCFYPFFIPRHTIVAGYTWFHVGCPRVCPSVRFLFPDDNLSKHQWIFTKLGMSIDIVEIKFGIANGQISSNFYGVICSGQAHIFVSGR